MSNRTNRLLLLLAGCLLICSTGCRVANNFLAQDELGDPPLPASTSIREAAPIQSTDDEIVAPTASGVPDFSHEQTRLGQAVRNDLNYGQPRTASQGLPTSFYDLTLNDAIAVGLRDTQILRQLNAQVLVNPGTVASSIDAAITDSNPNFGSAAALAAFDANMQSNIRYANNDDVFNNVFLGGGASEVRQKLSTADWRVNRTIANGTQMSLNTQIQHDFNNSQSNVFDHSWRTVLEASVRKPLWQGAGDEFNLIAGQMLSRVSDFQQAS